MPRIGDDESLWLNHLAKCARLASDCYGIVLTEKWLRCTLLIFALLGGQACSDGGTCGPKPIGCYADDDSLPDGFLEGCGTSFCAGLTRCTCSEGGWAEVVHECFCYSDARVRGPCNPLTQLDCEPGEKCALLEREDPLVARMWCVPDGVVLRDEPCEYNETTIFSGDNCSIGLHCIDGFCREICDATSLSTCRSSEHCQESEELFDDGIGVCIDFAPKANGGAQAGTVCPF